MMGGDIARVSQHIVHRHSCELADNGGGEIRRIELRAGGW